MSNLLVVEELSQKKKRLEEIRAELKTEFFGIDGCIDTIIESVKTWYLLPSIVTRPVIVNLWGLTGVGKTALARSLAAKLGYAGRFVEISMDGFSSANSYGQPTSICEILQSSSIEEGETGIIFLDEFQRYRTIDEHGVGVAVVRYQDVWQLLSDGYFSGDYSGLVRIEQELAYIEYNDDRNREDEAKQKAETAKKASEKPSASPECANSLTKAGYVKESLAEVISVPYKRKYSLYPYEARTIKKLLHLKEPLTEIMQWEGSKVTALIRAHAQLNENKTIDYTKCLVIIGGNLDEAFHMAEDVEDCDTGADVFYEYSKKIGIIEIKQALIKRFRPEQIARLGNNHIVYPSLTSAAYMAIIRRACQQYIGEAFKISGITFTIAESVYDEIFNNSVYPTQGARPVFTSIHKMFGSPLSDAILWALEKKITDVSVELDLENSSLIFSGNNEQKKIHIDFEIRERRNKRSPDFNALVAVHEAGHAVIYAELFKMAPIEVAINIASFNGGYNLYKQAFHSKAETLNRIAVSMGGMIAEELLFGQEMRSTGCASDVMMASGYAADYVRHMAMDGYASYIVPENSAGGSSYDSRMLESSKALEVIVGEQKERAKTIINKHRPFLIKLSKKLLEVKKMNSKAFTEFAKNYLDIIPANDKDVNGDYAERLDKL